jgi:hypothetical protein
MGLDQGFFFVSFAGAEVVVVPDVVMDVLAAAGLALCFFACSAAEAGSAKASAAIAAMPNRVFMR